MMRIARAAAICAALAVAPALAMAQGAGPAPTAAPGDAATAAPTDTGAAPAASSAAPVIPATGYGWTTKPTPKHHVRAVRASKNAPGAIMPGFEMNADGSSQLFVELTKPVQYDTKTS